MAIKLAMWLGGTAAVPESPPPSARHMAGSALFGGLDRTDNWFHFALSTPVIVDDRRPLLTRVFVLYRLRYASASALHVHDGGTLVETFSPWAEPPAPVPGGQNPTPPLTDRTGFIDGKSAFTLATPRALGLGLSVSLRVAFRSDVTDGVHPPVLRNIGSVEFLGAGADFAPAP